MASADIPFNADVHLAAPPCTAEQLGTVAELRKLLHEDPNYDEKWCTDHILQLFLIARQWNVSAARDMLHTTLAWRQLRQPSRVEQMDNWEEKMEKECRTGKVYTPGFDKYGRPVLILDNTVENTNNTEDQMLFLAWNMEFAVREMPVNRDKFVVFIHLDRFSIFNVPPFSSTKETIQMLSTCYPERLGHAIIYQPPTYFEVFFNTIKFLIDPHTVSKVTFIRGDVSDGSANDLLLKTIIGDHWKELTGATHPIHAPKSSPGYKHEVYWPAHVERVKRRVAIEQSAADTAVNSSDKNELREAASVEA